MRLISLFLLFVLLSSCDDAGRQVNLKAAEIIDNIAQRNMDNDVAGGFIKFQSP